ncbi:HWE histidine kinase domain-containing protein [Hoeflea ulvae]|uniref:histidine kinase n=1 Tax=Hoeflea ulvae TaxID=2983764 RepID=A0ABT3YHA1_9HYPH|nr:HWE histidine kinase domain-containing protein [Hoeflea ulvae]MCY0095275.1 PAS domain-containing protein [Hoeflea ulvae]
MTSKPLTDSDRMRIKLAGLRSAGVFTMYQDAELAIRFVANFPAGWPSEVDLDGKNDSALFGDQAAKVAAAKRRVLEGGEPSKLEILRDVDQDPHWFLLKMVPDIDADGVVIGVFTTILDIDDVKYREAVLKTLLRELNHRSKNLLAIVQSIATQTARSSDDLPGFLYSFRNRIQSMAQSQDLVTASDWRGAELLR